MLLVFSRAIQRFDFEYLKYLQEKFAAHHEHPTVLLVLEGEIGRREILRLSAPSDQSTEP